MSSATLGTAFDPRANALNFLRLLLASAVIFGHAALLGGYVLARPVMLAFSEVAVDGFFAVSGFLITRSWCTHPDWRRFLWHRSLRILPAFWVCLLATALVFAPISVMLQGYPLSSYWSASAGPWSYLWRNALLWIGQPAIAGTPNSVPFPGTWNGSLWSLYWEFLCYLGLGLLGAVGILARRRWVVLGVTVALWALVAVKAVVPSIDADYFASFNGQVIPRLALMFLVGSVLYLYADTVPVEGLFAAGSALLVVGALASGLDFRVLGALPLAYLLLWLGIRLPVRLGSRHDISYGVYIYAFPVQQLLAIAGLAAIGWLGYALLALAMTIPLAWLSWAVIERPALGWKSRGPRVMAGVPGAAAMAAVFVGFAALMLTGGGR